MMEFKTEDVDELVEFVGEVIGTMKPYLELANNDMVIELVKNTVSQYLSKPSKEVDQFVNSSIMYLTKKKALCLKAMYHELTTINSVGEQKFCDAEALKLIKIMLDSKKPSIDGLVKTTLEEYNKKTNK